MIPVIFFSLTVHEYSLGKIAVLLGDNTAKLLGRLSFNPYKQLDLMGTLFFCFVGFGWAKPVPVDPRNFDQPRRDMMYVAIAGPLSNLTLAVIFSFFIRMIEPCRVHEVIHMNQLTTGSCDYAILFIYKRPCNANIYKPITRLA